MQKTSHPRRIGSKTRRIHHISEDLHDQVIEKMEDKKFGLHLEEATDSNENLFICYINFLDDDC